MTGPSDHLAWSSTRAWWWSTRTSTTIMKNHCMQPDTSAERPPQPNRTCNEWTQLRKIFTENCLPKQRIKPPNVDAEQSPPRWTHMPANNHKKHTKQGTNFACWHSFLTNAVKAKCTPLELGKCIANVPWPGNTQCAYQMRDNVAIINPDTQNCVNQNRRHSGNRFDVSKSNA